VSDIWRYNADLIRVVDGDTVEFRVDLGFSVSHAITCRLRGIDAPEPRGETRKAGQDATSHLHGLLTVLKPLTIHTIKDRAGKYGRYLVYIYGSDGTNINLRMVEDGHAKWQG
jgi:micrococcal nuclease